MVENAGAELERGLNGDDPESEHLRLSIEVQGGCNVVAIRGEVDEITARRLCVAIVDGNEGRPVILDLREAPVLSPSTIRGLVRSRTTPTALVCPPGNVARLLGIVPGTGYVPVCDHLAPAIAIVTTVQLDSQ